MLGLRLLFHFLLLGDGLVLYGWRLLDLLDFILLHRSLVCVVVVGYVLKTVCPVKEESVGMSPDQVNRLILVIGLARV